MSKKNQSDSSLSDKADAAFQDVAEQVIKQAEQTGTPVVVWDKDHVEEIPVDEFERQTARKDGG